LFAHAAPTGSAAILGRFPPPRQGRKPLRSLCIFALHLLTLTVLGGGPDDSRKVRFAPGGLQNGRTAGQMAGQLQRVVAGDSRDREEPGFGCPRMVCW
jgi:hypothetical protein